MASARWIGVVEVVMRITLEVRGCKNVDVWELMIQNGVMWRILWFQVTHENDEGV